MGIDYDEDFVRDFIKKSPDEESARQVINASAQLQTLMFNKINQIFEQISSDVTIEDLDLYKSAILSEFGASLFVTHYINDYKITNGNITHYKEVFKSMRKMISKRLKNAKKP